MLLAMDSTIIFQIIVLGGLAIIRLSWLALSSTWAQRLYYVYMQLLIHDRACSIFRREFDSTALAISALGHAGVLNREQLLALQTLNSTANLAKHAGFTRVLDFRKLPSRPQRTRRVRHARRSSGVRRTLSLCELIPDNTQAQANGTGVAYTCSTERNYSADDCNKTKYSYHSEEDIAADVDESLSSSEGSVGRPSSLTDEAEFANLPAVSDHAGQALKDTSSCKRNSPREFVSGGLPHMETLELAVCRVKDFLDRVGNNFDCIYNDFDPCLTIAELTIMTGLTLMVFVGTFYFISGFWSRLIFFFAGISSSSFVGVAIITFRGADCYARARALTEASWDNTPDGRDGEDNAGG